MKWSAVFIIKMLDQRLIILENSIESFIQKKMLFFFFLKWWHAIWIIITLWGNYLNILILGNIFNPVINFAFSNYLRYSTFHQWEIFNKKLRVQMNTFLQKPRLNIWMIIDFWWVKKRYTYPYLYCASD